MISMSAANTRPTGEVCPDMGMSAANTGPTGEVCP
jgi:hypothetical protein